MIFFRNRDKVFEKIIGSPAEFSLFVRIFHIIMLSTLVVFLYNVPFNYIIGIPSVSLACFAMLLFFAYFYYLSRFKGKVITSIFVCGVMGNLMCVFVYFLNGGINGPVFLISALCIILIICCAPTKRYYFWIIAHLIILFVSMAIEYHMPGLVQGQYSSESMKFIDLGSSYLLLVLPIYSSIAYIRTQYELEKKSAEDRALSIEKQHQHIIYQNQELERLNKEKNKLVSIIAHDLRSPLSNIQSYLELLSDLELDEAEKHGIEEDLLRHTKNASELLTKLLAWSKSQMNGINVKLEEVNLLDTLKKMLETEGHIAEKKRIGFRYELDSDIRLKADGDMLELVVRNLVSNAIKFTPQGGHILVSTVLTANECWIKIADDGLGISESQQEDIFTFTAGSTFGTDKEKGAGLGLLLCKDFIEVQGGRIWFQSELGQGTTFFISLPLLDTPFSAN